MTDHHPQPAGPPPTPRQQRYLRQLAMRRGISFMPPRTCSEASRLIDELKRRAPDDMARSRGDSVRVIEGLETTGYGSSATWRRGAS